VECHTTYAEAGATATDACAGTAPVTPSGAVDVNTVGDYTVTYTSTDSSGNTATATRTVQVRDTVKPVIILTGPNPAFAECHTSYVDAGAMATDACAGTVSVSS